MKRLVLAVVALCAATSATPAHALEQPSPPDAAVPVAPESISYASYHGEIIDLRESWAGAQACHTDRHAHTTCFDSEREMDEFIAASDDAGGFKIERADLQWVTRLCRRHTSLQVSRLLLRCLQRRHQSRFLLARFRGCYLLRKKGIFSSSLSFFYLSLCGGKLLLKLAATQPQLLPMSLGLAQLRCHCRSLCGCRFPVLLLQLRRLRL